jgi:hypothetical protein
VAAYLTYATIIATVLTSSIMAPEIFILCKGMMASSLSAVSVQTPNSAPASCVDNAFMNMSSTVGFQNNVEHVTFGELLYSEDLRLIEENVNETEPLKMSELGMDYRFSLPARHSSDNSWNHRMSVKHYSGSEYQHLSDTSKYEKDSSSYSSVEHTFQSHLEELLNIGICQQSIRSLKICGGIKRPQKCFLEIKNGIPLGF